MNRTDTAKIPGIAHLKQSLATILRDARVPLKAIASEMEKSPSTVYGWADPHDFDNWPSLKALPQLLAYTDDATLLDYLASVQGRVTVALPSTQSDGLDQLAEMLEAFAAIVRHHGAARADGLVTEVEAALYREHGMRLVKAVLAQLAVIDAAAKAPRPFRKAVSA